MPKSSVALKKVTFRIPDNLYTAILEAAEQDTRPINSQVIVLLREALRAREAAQKAQAAEKPA
jgi:hypothetical protein